MPSVYQQENLEAMLGLFLEAQGHPIPQNSKSKSASALSRFLNVYDWSTRGVIRTTRNRVIKEILSERPLGRKPFLQVIIDQYGSVKYSSSFVMVWGRGKGEGGRGKSEVVKPFSFSLSPLTEPYWGRS